MTIGDLVANKRQEEPTAARYCKCGTRLRAKNTGVMCGACELAHRPVAAAPELYRRFCDKCGTDITHRAADAKYCSARCRNSRSRYVRPVEWTPCEMCGTEFLKKKRTARFCSTRCCGRAADLRVAADSERAERRRERNRVANLAPDVAERRREKSREANRRYRARRAAVRSAA